MIKTIKKIFHKEPGETFPELFNKIYMCKGNRNITIPNKCKPFIMTVGDDLDTSTGDINEKIREIRAKIIECYKFVITDKESIIKPKYYKLHKNFLKLIAMTDSEIKLEDDVAKKKAAERSKAKITKLTDDSDFEIEDDRIANDEYIDIKLPSDTRNYYNSVIEKTIRKYLESQSRCNSSILKTHKKIIDDIKLAIVQPEPVVKTEKPKITRMSQITAIMEERRRQELLAAQNAAEQPKLTINDYGVKPDDDVLVSRK